MIGAASKPNVTLSRPRGDLRQALHAPNTEHATWRVTIKPITEAPFTPTSTSPSSVSAQSERNKLGNYHCWNRVYDAFMGRWTTPDPTASPWRNHWDYCANNPPTTSDNSGLDPFVSPTGHPVGSPQDILERNRRIVAETKRAEAAGGVFFEFVFPPFNPTPDAGICGNFNFKVKWGLHNKQNASGWLVQEIDTTTHIVDCDGAVVMDQKLHYWEAWPVKDGNVYAGAAHFNEIQAGTRAGFDNFWNSRSYPGTRGKRASAGWAKFMEETDKLKPKTWGTSIKGAGGLNATNDSRKVPGWSRDGARTHRLSVEWECCCAPWTRSISAGTDNDWEQFEQSAWLGFEAVTGTSSAEGAKCTSGTEAGVTKSSK